MIALYNAHYFGVNFLGLAQFLLFYVATKNILNTNANTRIISGLGNGHQTFAVLGIFVARCMGDATPS